MMAKMHIMSAAIIAATVAAGGCGKENSDETKPAETPAVASEPAKDPNEVVISVCGKELKRGEIDADVEKIVAMQSGRIPAEQLSAAKTHFANQLGQQFLVETVLLDKAEKLGYQLTDEEVKAREAEFLKMVSGQPDAPKTIDEALSKHPLGKDRALAEMKAGILIDKMLKAEVTAKDTTDYSSRAQEIIDNIIAENEKCLDDAGALAKINELKAALDATPGEELAAKFAEIAKTDSACPSGKSAGGDLGEFTHGQMVKEFDEAAFAAEIGKIVGPVKTQYGYHLIMVTKKVPAVEATEDKPAEPEKVQASHILVKVGEKQELPKIDELIEYLKNSASRPKVNQFIMEALQNAQITASDDFKQVLPPPAAPKVEPVPEEVKDAAETAEKAVETPTEK